MEIKETQYNYVTSAREYLDDKEKIKEQKEQTILEEQESEAADPIKQMKQERERIRRTFSNKKNISYDPQKDLNSINSAVKSSQVRMIVGRLRSEAIRISKTQGDFRQKAVAVAKIKKLLKKANIKVKRLVNEERIDAKRKKAEKQKDMAEEKRLAKDLALKRKKRKALEHQDAINCAKGLGVNQVTEAEIREEMRLLGAEYTEYTSDTAVEATIGGEQYTYTDESVSVEAEGSVDVTL